MSDTPATLSVAAVQAARVALPCTCDGLEPHDLSCASTIPDSALRGALEAARPHLAAAECELLTDAYRALLSSALRALTVKPTLDTPYTDDPRWSPWTRWVEPEARRAHDLAQRIRKHLREHGVQPPSGPHGAAPGIWPELPAVAAARVAELEATLDEARAVARELARICPMRVIPLDLMDRMRALPWLLDGGQEPGPGEAGHPGPQGDEG